MGAPETKINSTFSTSSLQRTKYYTNIISANAQPFRYIFSKLGCVLKVVFPKALNESSHLVGNYQKTFRVSLVLLVLSPEHCA